MNRFNFITRPATFRQRHLRKIVIILILLPLAPLLFLIARDVYPKFHADWLFATCMAYKAPPVAYTEYVKERRDLLEKRDYSRYSNTSPGAAFLLPGPWNDLMRDVWSSSSANPVLFLHERTTPNGKTRLVAVSLVEVNRSLSETNGVFDLSVFKRGSLTALPRRSPMDPLYTRIAWDYGQVRFLSGAIDPKDGSHFMIAYTVGGRSGSIDGWLKDNDTVGLEPRWPLPQFPSTTAPAPPLPGKSP